MTPGRGGATLLALALVACAAPGGPEAPAPERGPRSAAAAAPVVLPDAQATAPRPGIVLLVSIAGLPPEAYRVDPAGGGDLSGAWMPNLAALARAGAAADGLVPVPGATPASAHATLVTGRSPAQHGIGSDHPLGSDGIGAERNRRAEALAAPALWNAAREAQLRVAALGWPTSVGAPVDLLFPEIFPTRLGESSPAILEGAATPALLDAARLLGADRPEAGFPGPSRDAILAALACELLSGPAPPRLLLLRLSQTEPVLRRDGRDGPEVRRAFAGADAELGHLLGCLGQAGRLPASAWIVTGDAPVLPVHTLIQPNVALEAAGLLVPSPGSRTGISRWDAAARSNGASAFVYARDRESALLARRALTEAAEESAAFRVVSAEEMLALGVDREAWFGLEARSGYAFGDGLRGGALLTASAARGAMGALVPTPESRLGFVAWGSGVRTGLRIPTLRQTDVAPTVAGLLGIALPAGEGRALVGVLSVPPVAAGGGAR